MSDTAEMFRQGEMTPDITEPQTLTPSAQEVLRRLIERIERVNGEIDDLTADRKDIFAEAKATGFDTKAIRKVIALRKLDRAERAEMEQIVDLYLAALGEL